VRMTSCEAKSGEPSGAMRSRPGRGWLDARDCATLANSNVPGGAVIRLLVRRLLKFSRNPTQARPLQIIR